MDYMNCCRTCLSSEKEMHHINSHVSIDGEEIHLFDILLNFYNYKVTPDPTFPDNICINCVHQLISTYSFKAVIDASSKTLMDNLSLFDSTSDNYDCKYESDEQKPECHVNKKNTKIKKETFDECHIDKKKSKIKKETFDECNKNKKKSKIRKESFDECNINKKKRKIKKEPFDECNINKKKSKMKKETFDDEIQLVFCVECKAEFPSVKLLNEHYTNIHRTKSKIENHCDVCNEKFEDFRSLALHRKLHLNPYVCENCWEGFYNEDELKNHCCQPNVENKEKKKSGKALRQCDECGKSYPPGYFRIHKLIHGNEHPYSCKFCPKKFKVPGSLHSHILWNHKRTRNYKCEVCNETFISSSSRCAHVRKHHLLERKYGCDGCEKRFFSKAHLEKHSVIHTGVKFQCHLCDKSYQAKYRLKAHLKTH